MTDIPPPVRKDVRTVAKKFVDGFLAATQPKLPPLPNPMEGGVGTEDDLWDYATPEMVETSRKHDVGNEGDTEAEPVRTINNALDFLGEVGEELLEHVIGHEPETMPKEKPYTIRTDSVPPHTWKGTTYTITNTYLQIARKSNERRTMQIINYGPDPVFIGDESGTGFGSQPNTVTVPVSSASGAGPWSPVSLNTQDEVWCHSLNGLVANPCTVEVLETFDRPSEHD